MTASKLYPDHTEPNLVEEAEENVPEVSDVSDESSEDSEIDEDSENEKEEDEENLNYENVDYQEYEDLFQAMMAAKENSTSEESLTSLEVSVSPTASEKTTVSDDSENRR